MRVKDNILILCFSQFEWDRTLFQRPQQVMLRLSKKYKILWIRRLSFRYLFLKTGPTGDPKNMRVNENLEVFNPIMLPTLYGRFPLIKYINIRITSLSMGGKSKKKFFFLFLFRFIFCNLLQKTNQMPGLLSIRNKFKKYLLSIWFDLLFSAEYPADFGLRS